MRSGLLAEIRWSVCRSKSHWSLCVSFSRTDAWLWKYHLFVWSNLNFLHISQLITLPIQSSQVLYTFCVNLQHSLFTRLMVSSLPPHNLHLLFCSVLSILAIIIFSLRVFHINFSWWSFTGVWVRENLFKSPGPFSVFWPFSIMLLFGWCPLDLQPPSHPVLLIILWWRQTKHQSQLV